MGMSMREALERRKERPRPRCSSVGVPHTPERGVGRPPRAGPPPSEHEARGVGSLVPFPAPLCFPCPVATCLGSVLVFVLRELDPPLPPRKGDHRVGAQRQETTCKAMMTNPRSTDRRHRSRRGILRFHKEFENEKGAEQQKAAGKREARAERQSQRARAGAAQAPGSAGIARWRAWAWAHGAWLCATSRPATASYVFHYGGGRFGGIIPPTRVLPLVLAPCTLLHVAARASEGAGSAAQHLGLTHHNVCGLRLCSHPLDNAVCWTPQRTVRDMRTRMRRRHRLRVLREMLDDSVTASLLGRPPGLRVSTLHE
eukprot:scaffold8085_cov127-Isochrysis_galbana.AAC.5